MPDEIPNTIFLLSENAHYCIIAHVSVHIWSPFTHLGSLIPV